MSMVIASGIESSATCKYEGSDARIPNIQLDRSVGDRYSVRKTDSSHF